MQSLIKNIIIVFILLNNSYCFADQSKQDRQELLMKGAYEYEKKADYTNDPSDSKYELKGLKCLVSKINFS